MISINNISRGKNEIKEFIIVTFNSVKISEFSASHILREIKIGESGASKIAIFTYFEALNFDFDEFLHFVKTKIDKKSKFRVSIMTKFLDAGIQDVSTSTSIVHDLIERYPDGNDESDKHI